MLHRLLILAGQENNQERNTIINWLSQLDYLGKQRDIFAKRHERTGQWLLNHEKFNTWLSADDNSVLWCHGIPGAGKTVMTATVISYLEDNTSSSNVGIAYVYCNYREPYTESEMFSSIIRQLSQQISPLPSEVKSFYITWLEKKSYPSNDVYITLITNISKLFRRTFVFVDALDECPEAIRESFIRLLLDLKPYVRLFLTSRGNVDLGATLGKLLSIDIVANSADVREFLEFKVDTSPRLSHLLKGKPGLRQEIIDTVHEKADGM
jgi:Cdc6-like AAA superfamily ATPase